MTQKDNYSTERLNALAEQSEVEDAIVFDIAQALLAFAKQVYARVRRNAEFEPTACTSELLEGAIRTALRRCGGFKSRKHFDNTIAQRIRLDAYTEVRFRREEHERLRRLAHQRPTAIDDAQLQLLEDLEAVLAAMGALEHSLPEAHAVVDLRIIQAAERHEAAEHLGLSVHQVDRRHQSALAHLRRSMGVHVDD